MTKTISNEREAYLLSCWCEESEDPESQSWREDLTAAEAALVDTWDAAYCSGVQQLCEKILEMEACHD